MGGWGDGKEKKVRGQVRSQKKGLKCTQNVGKKNESFSPSFPPLTHLHITATQKNTPFFFSTFCTPLLMGRRCKNIVEVEEAPQRGVLLEVERECWGVLKTCWSQLQPYRQQDVEQVDAEMLESRLEQGGYVLALDIDGTMLTTDYDEADDVMCVNARSGLRELLVRVSAVQPLVTIGILTAAGERYASGARRLVSDLVSGFTADIFDFCISEQILKDLSVIHDSQERVLLVDNDPTAIKPETRRNTVIVPDFDYNPKGRDPVFLDVAAMMQELTDSRLPVATFLERCTKQGKYIYLHKGFYYMVCRGCESES